MRKFLDINFLCINHCSFYINLKFIFMLKYNHKNLDDRDCVEDRLLELYSESDKEDFADQIICKKCGG